MIIGNMIVSHFFTNGKVWLANNAFGAFFLAGISICAWDLMVEGVKEKKVRPFWKGLGLFFADSSGSAGLVFIELSNE